MREKKREEIEALLTNLLHTLSDTEYLHMIQENEALKKYDYYAAKIDNGEYPESYFSQINEKEMDDIVYYLKKMANH